MSDLPTFSVAAIQAMIGAQYGIPVEAVDIDDECFGCVYATDNSLAQFYADHSNIYDYLIRDPRVPGDAVQLIRRKVGSDLVIDLEITDTECIPAGEGQPFIKFTRTDPMALPRTVELQYIDPDRDFAVNTQIATHPAARVQNGKLTLNSTFVIDSARARLLTFDILYRAWGQTLNASFEHPNPNIETADILHVTGKSGAFTMLVLQSTLSPKWTSIVNAVVLLTERGIIIAAGGADAFSTGPNATVDEFAVWVTGH